MDTELLNIRIKDRWTQKPSDKRIFGNFMESGFGRQIPGMWSEMIFNRSFREVPEYKKATWQWLGIEKELYNEHAPFWHSGYEEYDWEILGAPEIIHSCGNFTYKGKTSCMVINHEEGELCGLKQRGIHLKQQKKYKLRLFAGIRGNMEKAGLNGFGDAIRKEEARLLNVRVGRYTTAFELNTESKIYEWEFEAKKTEVTDISLTFLFQGTLLLSFVSLMPEDNISGWRKDVIERMKEAAPSVVRFPGGCFVSFYDWESSIGNRDEREPQPSFFWGGLEENDVGLDEFMELSSIVGFEPQICFNMMTSAPFKARQLVEYLNADSHTGMGRLRMLNGMEEPYGVKLFEMDNEPGRKWTARQYAEKCVEFAREMRLADPHIEFMLAAYSYDWEHLPMLLEIAGKYVQYVIYRQGNPEFTEKILGIIREYNEKNGRNVRLANTEWLPSCKSPEPFENPEIPQDFSWSGEIVNDYHKIFSTQQISWNYALNGAHRLLDYISYGGDFAIANFNNLCNTWGQNIIETTKDECYISCMGQIFAMFSRVFNDCVSANTETDNELVFALAVKEVQGRKLYVINHQSKEQMIKLPKGAWTFREGLKGAGRMCSEGKWKHCVEFCSLEIKNQKVCLPGLSFVCFQENKEKR